MNKVWLIFLLSIVCCRQLPAQPEPSVVVKIEYLTSKRGYQKQVFFSADSVIQIISNRGKEDFMKRRIDPTEWEGLLEALTEVKVEKIDSLLSPTSKRAFDGAMHTAISITIKSGESWSHTFDDEYPHQQLMPLMEAIRKIIGPNVGR